MESLLQELVLALNKDYLAIAVITVKDAIPSLVTEKAVIVTESYETFTFTEWTKITEHFERDEEFVNKYSGIIHSPSIKMFIPQVVLFKESDYTNAGPTHIRFSRRNILQRDHFTCLYCGKTPSKNELSLDHIVPKSKGGTNNWKNLATSCIYCNAKKGDKLLSEIGWTLRQEPTEPKWKSHIGIPFNQIKRNYWKNFLK